MYGHTMVELYGTRYGTKHSENVKKEMRKDTILFCLVLVWGYWMVVRSRNENWEM